MLQEFKRSLSAEEAGAAVESMAPWFHNLHLPNGVQTAPDHPLGDFPRTKWEVLAPYLPLNLHTWRVLDIGCSAGFYSFELAKRGAHVTAIDSDARFLRQAEWAAEQFGLEQQITFRQMQVYDLADEPGMYDLVLFMGVFNHLRYPMLGLDIVAQKVKRMMVFQTLTMPGDEVFTQTEELGISNREAMRDPGFPKMAFLEHHFEGDPTNWWVPNHAAVQAMLRAAGMIPGDCIGHEIYVCMPDTDHPSCMTTWNRAEYRAATQSSGTERSHASLADDAP